MKRGFQFFVFLALATLLFATSCQKETFNGPLPKVHIIATGGTIAGTSSEIGYDAGKVSIDAILQAVPEKSDIRYPLRLIRLSFFLYVGNWSAKIGKRKEPTIDYQ